MKFTRNMSGIDRAIRLFFGTLLLVVAGTFDLDLIMAVPVAVFGLVNVFSATVSHCPVYRVFGVSSCARSLSGSSPAEGSRPAK